MARISITELNNWLQSQPANTASNPYELEVLYCDHLAINGAKSFANILRNNPDKYVDLSATRFGYVYQTDDWTELFSECNSLVVSPTMRMPSTAVNCFSYCENLRAATLTSGQNLDGCFSGCTSLKSAIISFATSLKETFSNCTSLVNPPSIPNHVEHMDECFRGCSSLIATPNLLNCESLKDLNSTFLQCSSLTSISSLPKNIESLYDTFNSCNSLTSTPNINSNTYSKLVSMRQCFFSCEGLKEAFIPTTVTDFAACFGGCYRLEKIHWQYHSISNYNSMFYTCSSLNTFYTDNPIEVKNFLTTISADPNNFPNNPEQCYYYPESSPVTVPKNILNEKLAAWSANTPETAFSIKVTGLSLSDFPQESPNYDNFLKTTLKSNSRKYINFSSFSIPSGVLNMTRGFYGCKNLIRAPNFPNTVTNMYSCFYDCYNMKPAPAIPSGVTNVEFCFCNCRALTSSPTLPNGITSLVDCFAGCARLQRAPVIPDNVTDMSACFSGCTELVNPPSIPSGVTRLAYCFDNNSKLRTAPNIPDGVNSLTQTFKDCVQLRSAPTLPDSIRNLDYAFTNCQSLTSVPNLPASLEKMDYCFMDCSSLTSIPTIPNSVIRLISTFSGCTSLTSVPNIPDNVSSLSGCFYNCSSLTTVPHIPNNIHSMQSCFSGCSSLSVIPNVPGNVGSLANCFEGCTSLQEITLFEPDLNRIDTLIQFHQIMDCFKGCTSLTRIGVRTPYTLTEADEWHVYSLKVNTDSLSGKIFDKDGTSHTIAQTTVTKSSLKLPVLTDELWFPTGLTDAEIETVIGKMIQYKYGVFNKEVIQPDRKSFVLQAQDPNNVITNLPFLKQSDIVDTVTSGNMHSVTSNAVFNAIGQWEELYTDGSTISIKGMITNNGAYLKIWMQNYLLPSSDYPVFQLPAKYNNAMTHWVSRLYYFQNNNSAENPYDWCFANIEKNSGVINMYGTANLYCYGDFILSL